MAKKQKNKEEQLDLIDIQPENSKEIAKVARLYKQAQRERLTALKEELIQKQALLALIRKAHLQQLEGGVIKFKCDTLSISVTPRDELVKVKEAKEINHEDHEEKKKKT